MPLGGRNGCRISTAELKPGLLLRNKIKNKDKVGRVQEGRRKKKEYGGEEREGESRGNEISQEGDGPS